MSEEIKPNIEPISFYPEWKDWTIGMKEELLEEAISNPLFLEDLFNEGNIDAINYCIDNNATFSYEIGKELAKLGFQETILDKIDNLLGKDEEEKTQLESICLFHILMEANRFEQAQTLLGDLEKDDIAPKWRTELAFSLLNDTHSNQINISENGSKELMSNIIKKFGIEAVLNRIKSYDENQLPEEYFFTFAKKAYKELGAEAVFIIFQNANVFKIDHSKDALDLLFSGSTFSEKEKTEIMIAIQLIIENGTQNIDDKGEIPF